MAAVSQVGGCKQPLGPALCIFRVSKAASRMALTNAAGMVNCDEMRCDLCMSGHFFLVKSSLSASALNGSVNVLIH